MTDLNRKTVIDAPIDLMQPDREGTYKELDDWGREQVDSAVGERDSVIEKLDKAERGIDQEIKNQNTRRNTDGTPQAQQMTPSWNIGKISPC